MNTHVIFITGVSGSGKSTIGQLLTGEVNATLLEGDDFHSTGNKSKMATGIPLNDADRWPWLQAINSTIHDHLLTNTPIVVVCSALKESYRTRLLEGLTHQKVTWIHLQGSFDLLLERISLRNDHFMKADLLTSQLETYEEPQYGLKINIKNSKENIVQQILKNIEYMELNEFGLIGLGVMGTSLSRNIARNNITLSIYNRRVEGKEEEVALNATKTYEELSKSAPFEDLAAFVSSLTLPRKIMLMVNAGEPTDAVIKDLLPLLSPNDIIIDGGNSHYKDTERRAQELAQQTIRYIGTGVSGGEEGALLGPSIMPGGDVEAYKLVSPILKQIAARNAKGQVCCAHVGNGGAGHFVKMVHNGIEYAEMQLICEVYSIMRHSLSMNLTEIATTFETWNKGINSSYLLQITAEILTVKDEDGQPLIDKIKDSAGNKGTGSWTTIAACELGVAIPTITAALYARYQSSYFTERSAKSELFAMPESRIDLGLRELEQVLYFARIVNHHQGLRLIAEASQAHNWSVDMGNIGTIWSGGCIIRSELLIKYVNETLPASGDLLGSESFITLLNNNYDSIAKSLNILISTSIAIPCISASYDYFKYMFLKRSNAYLIQAQRDYFGAHTYERLDQEGKHHTLWSSHKS